MSIIKMVKPIQFCIPESKIVSHIPMKTRDFALYIPKFANDPEKYMFYEEKAYYENYQEAYYAFTWRKAGWDCLRHYEILANGCIPYFDDLEKCPPDIMFKLPKQLILEAMSLPGIDPNNQKIDHIIFDHTRYFEILRELLEYTRKHLTTRAMAQYLLNEIAYNQGQKILYISNNTDPDYMRCLILTGLKEVLGHLVVDCPKIPHIYKSYGDVNTLYGRGMSYTKNVDDIELDRTDANLDEFDFIIYGSVHRGLPFHEYVKDQPNVYYICGEDAHHHNCLPLGDKLFLRE